MSDGAAQFSSDPDVAFAGHPLMAVCDALRAEVARLQAELVEIAFDDDDRLRAVIIAVLCRLPDEVTGGDWEAYYAAHHAEWLGEHRAFGGWLSQRIQGVLKERNEARAHVELLRRAVDDPSIGRDAVWATMDREGV